MTYEPTYDTTIRTSTVVEKHTTQHVDYIDWDNYPFDDQGHTAGMGGSEEQKQQRIEERKSYLRECEKFRTREVYASNYGGWPRIWHRVLGVGMVSKWPHWTPRPAVLVESTLGVEWYDWLSLTGVEVREKVEASER